MSRKWNIQVPTSNDTDIVPPCGYTESTAITQEDSANQNVDDLIVKKSWAFAKAPMSQLFMVGFMLYMSGTSMQIFSIMMLGMSIWRPISAILGTNQSFAQFESSAKGRSFIAQKLVFIFFQFIALGMALYKCHYMGLLPTGRGFSSEVGKIEIPEVSLGFIE